MFVKIILFLAAYIIVSQIIKTIVRKSRYNRDRQSNFRHGTQGKTIKESGIEDADYEEIE